MKMLIRWLVLALGCGALAIAAACNSNGGSLQPATTGVSGLPSAEYTLPSGHPTVDPGVQDLPVEALLGQADLGGSWVQGTHQEDPLAPTDTYFCGKRVAAMPWTETAQFADDQTGDRMVEILSKFTDVASAQAAMKQERDAAANCNSWSSSTGADQIVWTINSVQTLDLGDEALAEKSTTQAGDPAETAYDFSVLVRKADVVILIDQGGMEDNDGTATIGFARQALDRLNAALASPTPGATPTPDATRIPDATP